MSAAPRRSTARNSKPTFGTPSSRASFRKALRKLPVRQLTDLAADVTAEAQARTGGKPPAPPKDFTQQSAVETIEAFLFGRGSMKAAHAALAWQIRQLEARVPLTPRAAARQVATGRIAPVAALAAVRAGAVVA